MFRINISTLILALLIICLTSCRHTETTKLKTGIVQTLNDNGAWCWFSDPRAIYYSDNEIITGWVKNEGSIEVASFSLATQKTETKIIYPQLQYDDHNNPAFTVLPDGNILTMFAWHGGKNGIIYNRTTNGYDIQSFGKNIIYIPKTEELIKQFPRETYTYANPYVLHAENNKLFSFGRWVGFKPNMIISTDNGKTWAEQYVIISNVPFDPTNRPYTKYYSDGESKIHMIYTNGHPRIEAFNSVYYCYYENGAFWRADDTKICNLSELPFSVEDGSLVYQAGMETGRAWISDIVVKDNTPYILYSRHPEETDHRYHYARFNSQTKKWKDTELCKAGKWFPQTPEGENEREPHYLGNMTFDPANPGIVYVSKEINGIFEIEKYQTRNNGKNWETTPITKNSEFDNVRPYVPRNKSSKAKTIILWMENKKYVHYTDFDTQIKYYVDNE